MGKCIGKDDFWKKNKNLKDSLANQMVRIKDLERRLQINLFIVIIVVSSSYVKNDLNFSIIKVIIKVLKVLAL